MGIRLLDLSALNQFLLTNRFNIGFGISFDFIYIIIAGAVMVLLGISILALKTERIEEMTVITDDVTVTLECINCGYHWDENFTKTQLQSMGFPQNRKISRRRCLFCGRFTRPNIISI